MSNQYLSFDVTKQSVPQELIIGRQGDSQLKFVSILFWDGEKNIPYDLTGKKVAFEALKPDGTHIVDTAGIAILNATGGLARYSFNEQVFAVAGTMQQAFFKITQTDSQNNVITDSTLEINIRVLENRVEFGINSTDYLSEYDKLIADVEKKFDDYAATIQKDITQAQAIHEQIIEYTNLINSNRVVTQDSLNDTIGDIQSASIAVDGGVVEPFVTALANFKKTINTSTNVAKIALIQDVHFQRSIYSEEYGDATSASLQQIQHLGKLNDAIDLVVNNGDLVHGRETKQATSNRIKQVVLMEGSSFENTPKMFTIGNHDDNNIYFSGTSRIKNILSTNELNSLYGTQSSYSFHDFDDKKLRVILLSAFENPEIYTASGLPKYTRDYNSVYSGAQINWLVNQALVTPTGYDILIFTHCAPQGYMNNLPYAGYTNVNHDILVGVLKAFANHGSYSATGSNSDYPVSVNCNFSSASGKLIGVVVGHEHRDANVKTDAGVNFIQRTCFLASGSGRQLGTINEDAFDIIEVDTTSKSINFNRFGSGSSLHFNY